MSDKQNINAKNNPVCPYCNAERNCYGLPERGFVTCNNCGKTYYYKLNNDTRLKIYKALRKDN